jgi:hypothetical protein
MRSAQEAFKLGFLSNCVESGLSIGEMRSRVKTAMDSLDSFEKRALAGEQTITKLLEILGEGSKYALGALAFAPPAIGAAGGIMASKLTDVDDEDVADVKKEELIDEYRRQAQKLRQTKQLRTFRDQSQGNFGGGLYL